LISNKQRGSLAKLPRLTGTRPGQTALGHWIAIVRSRAKGYAGSNLGRVSRIGRPGLVGRSGRRRYDADELSFGGAGRTSPDLAKYDAQGSNSTRVLVRGGVRDMRNPPRAIAGFCRGGAWCAAAEAALRWRISPGQVVERRQCSGLGVTGSVSMRKVSAGQNKGRAWLCCAML
jgi:hypothetical protein